MSWLLLALIGCKGDKAPEEVEDTGDSIVWETGAVEDTAAETGETGESGETAETGETGSEGWLELRAAPDDLLVNPGANWTLRASALGEDGRWSTVDASWSSADPAVVTVEGGVATAIAAGETTLQATLGSLAASVDVAVTDTLELVIRPVDAATGEALPGATAVLDDGERVEDEDEDGVIALTVPDGAPAVVTVYIRDYAAATLWGVVARDVAVPLRANDGLVVQTGEVLGAVDLSGVPSAAFDEIQVGFAAPGLRGPPLLADLEILIGAARTLEFFGLEADVPSNLYLDDVAEDYALEAELGPTAVWTLAGALPIAELTSGLEGTGDVFALLEAYKDQLVWGWAEGGELAADTALEADLAPALPLDRTVTAALGPLPLGFEGDEDALVLVGQTLAEEGLLVTGLGVGQGLVEVASADASLPDATGERAVALLQVGGLGSGGAVCAVSAEVVDGAVSLPDAPDAPSLSFAGETRSFTISTDEDASFVHVAVQSADGTVRDLYVNGGAVSGILPQAGLPFGYGRTTWSLVALNTRTGTFDGFVGAGQLDVDALAAEADAAARLTGRF